MLTKDTIKKIAENLKIKTEDFEAAITNEKEVEVTIPELTIFTTDELKTRDENLKRKNYEDAKTAGVEILVKELKEKTGVSVEGKDPYKFMDAYKEHILNEAKVEPSEKIKEQDGIIEKLKTTVKSIESEKKALEDRVKETTLQQQIFSGIKKEAIIPVSDVYTLMKTKGYSFTEEKGKIIASMHGEVIRDDKTQDALSGIDALDAFISENNLEKQADPDDPTGRGGKSTKTNTGAITRLSELEKKYKEEGKSINGSEFMAEAQKLAKDNPDFFKE
jgi:hypothetical protein